jgi:hypothetical protein
MPIATKLSGNGFRVILSPTPLIPLSITSGAGSETAIAEYCDGSKNLIDEEISALNTLILKDLGIIPPIFISQGMYSFVLQKYLESHPVNSLYLVDPLPPSPNKHAKFLSSRFSGTSDTLNGSTPSSNQFYSRYSEQLQNYDILTNVDNKLHLEAKSVPIFPIFSNCFASQTKEGPARLIRDEFIQFHQVDEDFILDLSYEGEEAMKAIEDFVCHWTEVMS